MSERTFDSVCERKRHVFGFQNIVTRTIDAAALRFGFSGQRGIVHLESVLFDYSNIGRYAIAGFDLQDIADDQMIGWDDSLLTSADDGCVLVKEIHRMDG